MCKIVDGMVVCGECVTVDDGGVKVGNTSQGNYNMNRDQAATATVLAPDLSQLQRAAVWDGTHWKPLRNLGFMLRNASAIVRLDVRQAPAGEWMAVLMARMADGRTYATPFADRTVLARWIARPVLMGLPLVWFGEQTTVRKGLV